MNKPSIDELLKKTDSRYMLVSIISKRAREIVDGSEILVKTNDTKAVNIAVEEFYQGKITYKE
ncbi:MAG: DNA-directed RNA polymerase subunit omega [Clostridiales bacterium 38_11]|nr:MAG: DNA-directed RNA polymerase subunit omega [Clostridiales bacterium 38_11]HBH12149.1 DNA-directed RNA polymerase subunit omega [Clostridiales bacterium]